MNILKNQQKRPNNPSHPISLSSFLLVLCLIPALLAAQGVPQAIQYQAVARNATGDVIPNVPISVRFSIHELTPAGSISWSEEHSTITNSLGLFRLPLGMGTKVGGSAASFDLVNWGIGDHFLQIELSEDGASWNDLGAIQLLSVPYALYAERSGYQGPQIAILKDYEPVNSPGVSFGTTPWDLQWAIRELDVIEGDTSFVQLTNNQFTLTPGEYILEGAVPGENCSYHICRIYNVDDDTYPIYGTVEYGGLISSDYGPTSSKIMGSIQISSSKTFEIQQYFKIGASAASGYPNIPISGGNSGSAFTTLRPISYIKITKIR